MNNPILVTSVLALLAGALCTVSAQGPGGGKKERAKVDPTKLPPASTQQGLTYAKDIRPLFEASCFRCHGEEKQKGELRLDSLEDVLKGSEFGKVIVPGDSAKSQLVAAVSGLDAEHSMPPKRRPGGPGGPGGFGGPGGAPGGRGPRPSGPGAAPGENVRRTSPGSPDQPRFGERPGGGARSPGGFGGGGPGGFGGGGPGGGGMGKSLTPEQVALVRAWIDQGAK